MSTAAPRIRRVPVPARLKPVLRFVYELHYLAVALTRRLGILFYKEPIFRGYTGHPSHPMVFFDMPAVRGAVDIELGKNVLFGGGQLQVEGGGGERRGRLVLRDNASLGANSRVKVHGEVVLEEHSIVGVNCWISDVDRYGGEPCGEPRPVRIGRYAWVANGAKIFSGVTVGEGAIVSAQSVVVNDVPAYSVVMGNPAEVYFRNVGRPKRKTT